MTLTVYHTASGIANTILCVPRNVEEKYSTKQKEQQKGKMRELCEWKGIKIIDAEACPDHIHLFVEILPQYSISGFMRYLKGKSAAMMYEQFGELKYKYRSREFGCKGYYVDIRLGGPLQEQQHNGKSDCQLIGADSNIFNLMGISSQTLKEHGMQEQASEMRQRITRCHSYDSALSIIGDYMNITSAEQVGDVSMEMA